MYAKPATIKQKRYLRWLAEKTGTTFTPPQSSEEASRMIEAMQNRRRTTRSDLTRERKQVACDMALRRGDAAQVGSQELVGYGSSARWAGVVDEADPRVDC